MDTGIGRNVRALACSVPAACLPWTLCGYIHEEILSPYFPGNCTAQLFWFFCECIRHSRLDWKKNEFHPNQCKNPFVVKDEPSLFCKRRPVLASHRRTYLIRNESAEYIVVFWIKRNMDFLLGDFSSNPAYFS